MPREPESISARTPGRDGRGIPTLQLRATPDDAAAAPQSGAMREGLTCNWDVQAAGAGPQHLDATAWNLGDLLLTCGDYPQRRMHRSLQMARTDQTDHYALALPLAGEAITALSASRRASVRAGEPLMTDLGQELTIEARGGRFLLAVIPRESIDDLLPRPLDLHVAPLQGGPAKLLAAHLRGFAEQLPSMSPDEAAAVATATLHLLVASLTQCPDISAIGRRAAEVSQLRQACRYIELHLKDADLDAGDVGEALRLSRATLYRLFERFGGVARYIKERRLIRVHGELAQRRGRPIARIADDFGFPDAAQFSRAFRDQFGYSPREVGVTNRGVAPFVGGAGGDGLSSWVRVLRG